MPPPPPPSARWRRPVAALVGWAVARPGATVAIATLLLAAALATVSARFAMLTDTAALIAPDVDWRRQERAAQAAFPQFADTLLVVVDGATPELAEDAAARLAARMASDRAHVRSVVRPDGGAFFARQGLLYESRGEVAAAMGRIVAARPLLGALAADPSLRGVADALGPPPGAATAGRADLAWLAAPMRTLAVAANDAAAGRPPAFSWQTLLAGEGDAPPTRRLVLAQAVLDHGALMPGEAASGAVRAAAAALHLDPAHGIRIALTGEVPLADEEFATLQENIGLVGLAMAAAMLATLWLATRSVRMVAAIVATTLAGLAVTAALGLLAVGRFNLISVAFIPLFVGLGVDFGIQIAVRFNAERAGGAAPPAAMTRAADALGPSLLLAAAAVFLGFAAFLPTDYVGIAELGIVSGIGMVVALAFSVTLLPALTTLLPPPVRRGGKAAMPGFAQADRWLARHRRAVVGLFGVALVGSVAALPLARFDFNPLHLRDPAAPAMGALADMTRDPQRTPNTIDVLARDAATADRLARRLSALPEVGQVVRLASFVPDDQPAKLAAIAATARLVAPALSPAIVAPPPSDAALVASLRTAAARLDAAAAGGGPGAAEARALAAAFRRLEVAGPMPRARMNAAVAQPLRITLGGLRAALAATPVTADTLPRALRRDWIASDGQVRLQLFPAGDPADNDALRRFRDAAASVTPALSGLPVATQAAASTVARAFVEAGVLAFLLVSLLLGAVLRDVREVLFTLAPVILAIFLTLGTCVAIGQPINFANIIAFPLLFGVGVAFHIYFVMAWRGGETRLLSSSLARAVLFSALATGTAFGSLWLSRHPGTAGMGKILLISLVWTLICALVFEPALLGPARAGGSSRGHRRSARV